jgi:hypothetical protein
MSFASIANLLSAGVGGAGVVVGPAQQIPATEGSPISLPPLDEGEGVPVVLGTYELPDNMKNAKSYLLTMSGSFYDTDGDATSTEPTALYWTGNEDGSGVDGTETYLNWLPVNIGIGPSFNRVFFSQDLRVTLASVDSPNSCSTNQIQMWYHPETTTTENLYFIGVNGDSTSTAFNIDGDAPQGITVRCYAFF